MSEIHSIDAEDDQFAYRYDTQLLIDKRDKDLDEDEISDYITEHFEGNSLIAAGDEDLVKIHFHTNEPWKILEYCNTVGEIYDIVVEDMIRQTAGLQGYKQAPPTHKCQRSLDLQLIIIIIYSSSFFFFQTLLQIQQTIP